MVFLPGGAGLGGYDVAPNFSATKNYASVTKLALSIDRIDRTATQIRRAFHTARQGRPGPVVVEMHGDVLGQQVPEGAAEAYQPSTMMRSVPSRGDVKDAVKALLDAQRPVIWAGQGILYADACDELKAFAELTQIPVITTMQGKSAFPDDHPLALGSANRTAPKAVFKWLGMADTVLAIGSGLTRTGFGLPIPGGKFLIHSTTSVEDINKDYAADLGLVGDAKLTLEAMIDEAKAVLGEDGRAEDGRVAESIAATKAEWLAEWAPLLNSDETPINPYRVIREINRCVDHADTVVTHDAGNPRDQIMPFYHASEPRGYIGWGKTTHLGYGIPLVIGAKMANPEKFCMNFMGDLAFGHTGMEIETAVRADIPITTVVINNLTMGGYDEKMPVAMAEYGCRQPIRRLRRRCASPGRKGRACNRRRRHRPCARGCQTGQRGRAGCDDRDSDSTGDALLDLSQAVDTSLAGHARYWCECRTNNVRSAVRKPRPERVSCTQAPRWGALVGVEVRWRGCCSIRCNMWGRRRMVARAQQQRERGLRSVITGL